MKLKHFLTYIFIWNCAGAQWSPCDLRTCTNKSLISSVRSYMTLRTFDNFRGHFCVFSTSVFGFEMKYAVRSNTLAICRFFTRLMFYDLLNVEVQKKSGAWCQTIIVGHQNIISNFFLKTVGCVGIFSQRNLSSKDCKGAQMSSIPATTVLRQDYKKYLPHHWQDEESSPTSWENALRLKRHATILTPIMTP